MLLKKFLEEEKLSLNEIVNKYSIHYGKNSSDGYHMNYSDALNTEDFGLKRSKKIQSILFFDYVSKLPKKRTKNRICFSYKLEKADVNYTRTLIKLINEKGYSFTRDADACNVFVCYDDEDSDKRKTCAMQVKKRDVVIMSVKDFEKQIGYTRNAEFNDKEFLAEYYETKL